MTIISRANATRTSLKTLLFGAIPFFPIYLPIHADSPIRSLTRDYLEIAYFRRSFGFRTIFHPILSPFTDGQDGHQGLLGNSVF